MGAEEETRRLVDPTLSFADPRLAKLASYWQEQAKDDRIPDRAAFGPDELHRFGLVTNVVLLDVLDGGARFRLRLIAAGLTAISGRDNTGRFLDEIYAPADYAPIADSIRWILREHRPLRSTGTFAMVGKDYVAYEAFTAPLASGGADPVMVIIAVVRRSRAVPRAPATDA
jgi:hypothetical protein